MVHPRDLAVLLRDPSKWPVGFSWNFYDCNRCAMGLMSAAWNIQARTPGRAAVALGISSDQAHDIFGSRYTGHAFPAHRGHEPEDIAADLEALDA